MLFTIQKRVMRLCANNILFQTANRCLNNKYNISTFILNVYGHYEILEIISR